MMLSLPEIARAVRGQVAGRQVLAPGPGHSHRDRSLAIWLSSKSQDGFSVHSHAGDPWQQCRDHVADALGFDRDRWRGQREPDPVENMRRRAAQRAAVEAERTDAERRQQRALAIWDAGKDPSGTPIQRYLEGRGLYLPEGGAGSVIRYVERCPFGPGQTMPAMVALMRCVRTGAAQAIHRTALTPEGRKLGRKMLGPSACTAVMLDSSEAVSTGLAVGEGIESCLAARQLGIRPTWALGSTGGVAGFPILPGIETLTLLVENDENGASERACRATAIRWHEAGRAVDFVRPKVGSDLNDALREGAAA